MTQMNNRLEQMILCESTHNSSVKYKLKPLKKAGIRKPCMFWPELFLLNLYEKRVSWCDQLTVEYEIETETY